MNCQKCNVNKAEWVMSKNGHKVCTKCRVVFYNEPYSPINHFLLGFEEIVELDGSQKTIDVPDELTVGARYLVKVYRIEEESL